VLANGRRKLRSVHLLGPMMLATLILAASASGPAADVVPPPTVEIQLLAFNDFHGRLAPPEGPNGQIEGIPAGGVEYFATHVRQREATQPNTLVVSAGGSHRGQPVAVSALP
jgi:5'-nucleotidase